MMDVNPIICWLRDGSAKKVSPVTAESLVLTELQSSADTLREVMVALRDLADQIEWQNDDFAHELRRVSDRCMQQSRGVCAVIARATGEPT